MIDSIDLLRKIQRRYWWLLKEVLVEREFGGNKIIFKFITFDDKTYIAEFKDLDLLLKRHHCKFKEQSKEAEIFIPTKLELVKDEQ
jgi:hypothetical protein